jgi:hypothetical protein
MLLKNFPFSNYCFSFPGEPRLADPSFAFGGEHFELGVIRILRIVLYFKHIAGYNDLVLSLQPIIPPARIDHFRNMELVLWLFR